MPDRHVTNFSFRLAVIRREKNRKNGRTWRRLGNGDGGCLATGQPEVGSRIIRQSLVSQTTSSGIDVFVPAQLLPLTR